MGDPITLGLSAIPAALGGATVSGLSGGGKKGGGGPTQGQKDAQGMQNLMSMATLPQAIKQTVQGQAFQQGDIGLEDTYLAPTLIGPENLAYKAAQGRALENLPEGGQINQAFGQIEAQRAQQDAAARQSAAMTLMGPAPAMTGFNQSNALLGNLANSVAQGNQFQAQMGQQSMGGLGQLMGTGLMSAALKGG